MATTVQNYQVGTLVIDMYDTQTPDLARNRQRPSPNHDQFLPIPPRWQNSRSEAASAVQLFENSPNHPPRMLCFSPFSHTRGGPQCPSRAEIS